MNSQESRMAKSYADQLVTQLRKGLLSYLVLLAAEEPTYTSDLIRRLKSAGLTVVEGTIYPLLSRLSRDGLLAYQWRESDQGPPRKYYQVTELGRDVARELTKEVARINASVNELETSHQPTGNLIIKGEESE